MVSRIIAHSALALVLAGGLGACAHIENPVLFEVFTGLEKSSPTQTAAGVRTSVPFAESEAGTFLAVGGVQRQWFDGGHDMVFTGGVQGRRTLSNSETWVGAEGTYNNWRVTDGSQDPVANVIGFSGLVGRPIGSGAVHVWGSAGVLLFSDFEKDGFLVYEGGTGWQLNVGVELRELFGGN